MVLCYICIQHLIFSYFLLTICVYISNVSLLSIRQGFDNIFFTTIENLCYFIFKDFNRYYNALKTKLNSFYLYIYP